MDKVSISWNVFFEEPFWIGILEQIEDKRLSVCKVTFGAEPKEYELCEFILKNYDSLQFSPSVTIGVKEKKQNPKRIQREVHKCMQNSTIGTKSQQALKLQQEQRKVERKVKSKEQKEAEKEKQFELKQQKKKEKKKGR